VQFDYTFAKSSEETDRLVPILVGIMCSTGYAYAAVAKAKGVFRDQMLVKDIQVWLEEAGLHGRVRLRSDGEPSVVAVLRAVAAARGRGPDGRTMTLVDNDDEPLTKIEQTPNKSSASLGGAERFAETLGGLLRTHREDLRERYGVAVKADSLAFEWLVSYVTYLYNRFQVRVNGLTPYEDLHGRYFREPLFKFGQPVLVRRPTATLQAKLEPR
jgi:hypothetical protein